MSEQGRPDGEWVRYADYERLRNSAERARTTLFSIAQNPQLSMATIEGWAQESHDDLRAALHPPAQKGTDHE